MKRSVQDLTLGDLKGVRVFLRSDLNVPLDSQGNITDDSRLLASLPTLNFLIDKGAKIILASHLGRPNGKIVESIRLTPIQKRLAELLKQTIIKADDCTGEALEVRSQELHEGEVLLLENLRFYAEETKNDTTFSKALSKLADLFVLDAFGCAHRAHASTVGIATFLPAYSGLLLEKEYEVLDTILSGAKKPFLAIIGGAKVSTKIGVLKSLLGVVDTLIIGGGMAFTFFKAQGKEVGNSLLELDKLEEARHFLEAAKRSSTVVQLPSDIVVADDFQADAQYETVSADALPNGRMGLDIGPESVKAFELIISQAETILWNGPLGVFEFDAFSKGTTAIAEAVSKSQAISIVGGGDSVAALKKTGLEDKISFVSTGGGASLAFLEGQELPGLSVIPEHNTV